MFLLFFSLYRAMFTGNWHLYTLYEFTNIGQDAYLGLKNIGTNLSEFLTSIFGDVSSTALGNIFTYNDIIFLTSFILALITSIGIVVMAVKGIKHIFTIFFEGLR